jgi:hypothetical protein
MDLVYLQIECEHSFSRMLASQKSDKTGLDVTLEYFESVSRQHQWNKLSRLVKG